MVQAVLGVGVPVIAVVSLTSQPLMELIFGYAFRDSAPLLEILIWKTVFLALGGLYRNVVIAHRPMFDFRVTLAGVSVAAVAMLSLVPVLGATGAAIGTLLGEATLLVGYALAARRWVGLMPRVPLSWLLRLSVGLVLLSVAGSVVQGQPSVERIAAIAGCGAIVILLVNLPLARHLWGGLKTQR
jgi:O-antigen/teichoic acid export membrane protein